MGNISLGYASKLDASGRLHEFEPGEELPDWVLGKEAVSAPVHSPISVDVDLTETARSEAALIVEAAHAEAAKIVALATQQVEQENADKSDPEESAESTEGDDNATAEESGEPDFTKPAPAKRGRPRKQV